MFRVKGVDAKMDQTNKGKRLVSLNERLQSQTSKYSYFKVTVEQTLVHRWVGFYESGAYGVLYLLK
jgi:hypothetical protein